MQEFRVITQNYRAEYENASSAIITAVTKSGANEMQGEAFLFYQPKARVSTAGDGKMGFRYASLTTNPDYTRLQPGISLGGPIMKDKLHYFVSYEGTKTDATNQVLMPAALAQYNGAFGADFKSNLLFGKLSWQPGTNQLVDFSTNWRSEYDTRDFGGTTAFEHGVKLKNDVWGATARHQWTGAAQVNQATLSYQVYEWNPVSLESRPDRQELQRPGSHRRQLDGAGLQAVTSRAPR